MLKKITVVLFLIFFSSFSFAKNLDSTLTVAPNHPDDWGYMAATVSVNNGTPLSVGHSGITVPIALNDSISLTVYAMNAKPALAESCKNLRVREEGRHQLLFELKKDWLIHCRL